MRRRGGVMYSLGCRRHGRQGRAVRRSAPRFPAGTVRRERPGAAAARVITRAVRGRKSPDLRGVAPVSHIMFPDRLPSGEPNACKCRYGCELGRMPRPTGSATHPATRSREGCHDAGPLLRVVTPAVNGVSARCHAPPRLVRDGAEVIGAVPATGVTGWPVPICAPTGGIPPTSPWFVTLSR